MPIPAQSFQELLGRHMSACRTLAGLSQQQMATRLKVQQPYVGQLERGAWRNIDPQSSSNTSRSGSMSRQCSRNGGRHAEAWAALRSMPGSLTPPERRRMSP